MVIITASLTNLELWLLQTNSTPTSYFLVLLLFAFLMLGLGLWLRPYFDKIQANRNRSIQQANQPYEPPAIDTTALVNEDDRQNKFDEFESDYRQKILQRFENFSFWQASTQDHIQLPQEEFYVRPYFHLYSEEQALRLRDLLNRNKHIFLLGPPGCGKTSTILYLLVTQARKNTLDTLGIPNDLIPIMLSVNQLSIALGTVVHMPLSTVIQQLMPSAPPDYVKTNLSAGRFLILLDNLNELYISDARRVVEWLDGQIAEYPRNRFVAVGRPELQSSLAQCNNLELAQFAQFEMDTLEQFARKWQTVIPDASDTMTRILRDDATFALARTPFHLLMMLVVSDALSFLPTRRVELYPTYLDALLTFHSEADQEEHTPFSEAERRTLLQTLAFTMHQHHQVFLNRATMSKALRGVLETNEDDGELFIEMCLETGILLQKGDRCRFTHLNLQEFLVAREIIESNLNQLLRKQTHDLWWREVINFYAELTDSHPVINRVFTEETEDLITGDRKPSFTLTLLNETIDPPEDIDLTMVSSSTVLVQMETDETEKAADPPSEPKPSDKKPLILVVDDTPQNLKFARFILERGGYAVAEADDALKALEWLKTNRPTLILSDIQMPNMNGFEFCQAVKADETIRNLPFIFVTAFSRASKEIVRGLKMGADDYVPRPFAPEELLARIGANVRVHQAEEEARKQANILARRNRELAIINEIQQAVTASLNVDEVMESALYEVQKVIDAEATSLWFVDRENQTLVLSAVYNPTTAPKNNDQLARVKRLPLHDKGVYAQVVKSGEPFLAFDVLDETDQQLIMPHTNDPVRSLICVPMRVRDRVMGILQAIHREVTKFTKDDLNVLIAVADAVTVAVENAWLFGQLQGFNQQLEQKVQARTRELTTEKEKTETILVSIADGLLVVDPDNFIVRANPAMESLLEANLSELAGTSIDHSDFDTALWDFVRRITKQSKNTVTEAVDVPSTKIHNKILSYQANSAKMWDPNHSTYLGTVIALRDVTALQEIDRMKANFMTGITHELKTPLAIIALQLGGLLKYFDQLDREKKMEMLHKIDRATELLTRLVDSILELSKLDSGMSTFNFSTVNLVVLVEQVVQELQPLANEKALWLTFNTSQPTININADQNQLERVIRNLVENGIKYTPEGKVEVEIYQDNGHAIFQVQDTGIGLTEEQIERLFERFYRADNQRNILGTGLGLSISEEIIKIHHGEIKVTSTLNEGSTFKVFLPLI